MEIHHDSDFAAEGIVAIPNTGLDPDVRSIGQESFAAHLPNGRY